ncbi:hypothetical protein [Bradyrhizobium sp. SZCCHNS3002]|uniref:hypothetical protein n=1 Tax=Bradyrhizobium sp. SZCCHNS3002 TaxID=3057310 RepID=UPI0028EC7ADE|nr:hypothetical protein [Bradyrhizobium sp. SZCCHNS3002]
MTSKRPVELLIGYARENPTLDAAKARAMFEKFMAGGFSYDEISNRPDCPAYASAEVLAIILPLMIDEMLAREDTGNFLIYPMIAAVDPSGEGRAWMAERAEELAQLVDHEGAEKILRLLTVARADPPVPIERLDRIGAFWKGKAEASAPPS